MSSEGIAIAILAGVAWVIVNAWLEYRRRVRQHKKAMHFLIDVECVKTLAVHQLMQLHMMRASLCRDPEELKLIKNEMDQDIKTTEAEFNKAAKKFFEEKFGKATT